MLKYILKRLLMLIPTMLGIALLVLFIIDLTPGDPARMLLGTNATEEQVEELREELGLNRPFFARYLDFIVKVCHGIVVFFVQLIEQVVQPDHSFIFLQVDTAEMYVGRHVSEQGRHILF